jgi:hypothetical protein
VIAKKGAITKIIYFPSKEKRQKIYHIYIENYADSAPAGYINKQLQILKTKNATWYKFFHISFKTLYLISFFIIPPG